jgi:predicted nucleotidyltransferase
MKSWTEYKRLHDQLTGSGAPFRGTATEHRFIHKSGTTVDLVPFGDIEEPEGTIEWPDSHAVMTVIGFREADEHAAQVQLAAGVQVRVVTIPALVILKLVAHRDRRKTDDLADVLFILENYSRYELEDRIFDELSDQLASGALPFDRAGAFLLGRDMAAQCNPSNRPKLATILNDLLREPDTLARLLPPALEQDSWDKRFAFIADLFGRLRDGFVP